jgi:PGF-CTERM protein
MKPARLPAIALLAVVGATLLAAPAAAQSMTDDDTSGNETMMNDGSMVTTESMDDESMARNTTETMNDGSMAQETTETAMGEEMTGQMDDSDTTSGSGPGFTVVLALVALAGIGLLAARRRA